MKRRGNMKFRARLWAPMLFGLLVAATRAGVPGTGMVVPAISDEFEQPWTFNYQSNTSSNGLWYGSFRGAPEILSLVVPPDGADSTSTAALRLRSIDTTDDTSPGAEDLVSQFYSTTTFGRAVTLADEPSYVTWAWFPPISTWPLTAEGSNCFGFRLAARDHTLIEPDNSTGEYYPSIWAFRGSDGGGYLVARVGDGYVEDVVIASIPSGGWYTLGMSWNAQGQTEYYAASGRVSLQAGDRRYTDTASARRMETVPYHFYSLRFPATGSASPDFLADRCRVFTRSQARVPTLTALAPSGSMSRIMIDGATAGVVYRIEKRVSPGGWQEVERFLSDGQPRLFTSRLPRSQTFYRVTAVDGPAPGPSRFLVAHSRLPFRGAAPADHGLPRRLSPPPKMPPAAAPLPAAGRLRSAPTW